MNKLYYVIYDYECDYITKRKLDSIYNNGEELDTTKDEFILETNLGVLVLNEFGGVSGLYSSVEEAVYYLPDNYEIIQLE